MDQYLGIQNKLQWSASTMRDGQANSSQSLKTNSRLCPSSLTRDGVFFITFDGCLKNSVAKPACPIFSCFTLYMLDTLENVDRQQQLIPLAHRHD
jgi:hypothetical protein